MVRALSRCRDFVNENNWGVVPLAPTRVSSPEHVVEYEPSHGDLQVLKYNVTSLPSLLLLSTSGKSLLGEILGREKL